MVSLGGASGGKVHLIIVLCMYLLVLSFTLSFFCAVVYPEYAVDTIQIATSENPNAIQVVNMMNYFFMFVSPFTLMIDEAIFPNLLYIPFVLMPKYALIALVLSLIFGG